MALRNAISTLVRYALIAHVVVTAFENMPDDKLSIRLRIPFLSVIPQWCFFAPNPGMEDLYILYRKRHKSPSWTEWKDLSFRNEQNPYSAFWNPGSRNPKALFDTASQVRILASSGATFEWILGSDGYLLLRDAVRDRCVDEGLADAFQFMILAAVPGEGKDGIKPIVVSPESSISNLERGRP